MMNDRVKKRGLLGVLRSRAVCFCFLAVFFGGCGDDDTSGIDDAGVVDGEVTQDAEALDADQIDAEVESPCPTQVLLDTDLELDPQGPNTQIHASASFDGEDIWVVYNLPDTDGYFDVWGLKIQCNGQTAMEPQLLNTITENNEVDPSVACAGENVYVVWNADNGTGINNMDAFYRTFEEDGTPIMATEESLETTHDGTPVVGNVMFPIVDAVGTDSFWVAGVRGLEATGTFHYFAQEISYQGDLLGEAIDPIIESGVTHSNPALEVSSQGDLFFAWSRTEGADDEAIHHTYLESGETQVETPVAALEGAKASSVAYWAGNLGGQRRVVMALGSISGNILLTDGESLDPGKDFVFAGDGMGRDHSPALAGGQEHGLLAFYRNISGLKNEIIVQPFTYDGVDFNLEHEETVTEDPAAPYGLAFTSLGGGYYFLAWSQGTSPDFRLMGRFIFVAP